MPFDRSINSLWDGVLTKIQDVKGAGVITGTIEILRRETILNSDLIFAQSAPRFYFTYEYDKEISSNFRDARAAPFVLVVPRTHKIALLLKMGSVPWLQNRNTVCSLITANTVFTTYNFFLYNKRIRNEMTESNYKASHQKFK